MLRGTVEIDRLRLEAFHGVMPQERRVGNMFEVSLLLDYDMEQAALSDNVAYALNYAEVCAVVKEIMQKPSDLLEHVALRLRDELRHHFPAILSGTIKIAKPTPPMGLQLSGCAVILNF